jgi:uncharacterized protein (DUF1501 family)
MRRRDFIKRFTLLPTAAGVPAFLASSVKANRPDQAGSDRILVVVELAGGCDGLNTVIPFGSHDYYSNRMNLGIPADRVLTVNDFLGFHPAMIEFKSLFDDGLLAIVQGVGYPNPNRSHFRSRDIWHTAEVEESRHDGWLARYLTATGDKSVQGFNVGGKVPKAMISAQGSPPSIQSIESYRFWTDPRYPRDQQNKNRALAGILAYREGRYPLEDFVSQTVMDAAVSSASPLEGNQNYQSSVEYPDNPFGRNLQTVAQIIAAEFGVSVFYTTLGGFDTHAAQVSSADSTQGVHANLLGTLSTGIKAFLDDMREMGLEDRVLVMTFSEFGRRLSENVSMGTDHGTANLMFLLGGRINPGLYGTYPGLAQSDLDEVGDVVYTVDFRSVYATVLSGWLNADPELILGEPFPLLNLL